MHIVSYCILSLNTVTIVNTPILGSQTTSFCMCTTESGRLFKPLIFIQVFNIIMNTIPVSLLGLNNSNADFNGSKQHSCSCCYSFCHHYIFSDHFIASHSVCYYHFKEEIRWACTRMYMYLGTYVCIIYVMYVIHCYIYYCIHVHIITYLFIQLIHLKTNWLALRMLLMTLPVTHWECPHRPKWPAQRTSPILLLRNLRMTPWKSHLLSTLLHTMKWN